MTRVALRGGRAAAATATCLLVLGLAFILPVGQLALWAAETAFADARAGFLGPLVSTLTLAGLATTAACVLALTLAYAVRLHPSAGVRLSAQLASMGYALPGSVIAVGILVPVTALDHVLVDALERLLDRPVSLLLTGSATILVFAYVVRFLAVSFQTLDASLAKIPPSLDDAARSLGVSTGGTLRRIHLPLMRAGLFTALILVFVETMKEMPATLLLRPFGLDTLAVLVWERTAESLWAEAAIPALAIVVAGLLPVFLMIRVTATAQR